MTQRLIDQAAEVLTRYLGHGANTESTAQALNLLGNILEEDYPELHAKAVSEGLDIARSQVASQ